ncbi:MAG TPA: NFACT family protein [Myxococcota bacterium]|nr:NFACT family protein [Myxococcota bacterium]
MTLSVTELEAVVADLQATLAGAAFQDFRQIDETSAVLVLGTPAGVRFVRVTAAPRQSRIHLTRQPPPRVRGATGFSFEGRVFRELKGMALADVRVAFRDRVVVLRFQGPDFGRKLIFECSGHHANLFLADERDEILALMVASHSHRRDLRPGRRYAKPLKVEGDSLDAFRFAEGAGAGDLSARIEAAYAAEAAREADAARAAHVRQRLRARLDADTRLAERLRGDLERAADAPASFAPPPDPGAPSGRAARQAEARPAIQARLDQAMLRIGRVQAAIMALLEGLPDAVAQGEAVLREVEGADRPATPARPETASRGPRTPGAAASRPVAPAAPPPGRGRHRVFRTRAGNPILVASDPRDNAVLTFGTATDDDLWFQVEGGGGAHVVLPASRDDRPFDELLDAALLAVHFSGADPLRENPVTCTHRRNLRPERQSSEPGAVRVVRAQTIRVRPDATRLKRLLGSERREQGGRPGKAPPRRSEPR